MLRQTSQKRELFASTLKKISLGVFAVILLSIAWTSLRPQTTAAATSSYLNFQARLQTAAGAIVPDGNYFIEFNLYKASSGGTSVWTERYQGSSYSCPFGSATGATNTKVVVANGFVTVNLGSLCTFPTTINWDQQLWLTMNVGGSGVTASYDGEMSPRLQLTAVPYAFKAGQLAQANSGGTLFSTLNLLAPTGGNQVFQIQDQTVGGTFNILTAPNGSDGYVKLQGSTPGTAQTGSLNISGTAIVSALQGGTGLFQPATDSTSAFNIKTSGTNNIFTVDTVNSRVGINLGSSNTPTLQGSGLEINGAIRLSGGASSGTTDYYVTPLGTNLVTKINIPNYDPGAFNQIIAFGLARCVNPTEISPTCAVSGYASSTARAITIADNRIAGHQPTISILSPDENNIFGLSYDGTTGSGATGYLLSTNNNLALRANGRTQLTASYTGSTTGSVTIGDPGSVQGSLIFANSTNSNGVIVTSGTTSSQYTVQLPTAIGSVGQCLNIVSVASTTETLGYTSCAGGGVATVGALDGGTANATGATISSPTIYLQSASGSFAGLVNTGSQAFTGNKTFNTGITIGANSGNGALINNGTTVNTVLVVGNLATGGTIGTASLTVDAYTAASVAQTTASQTITIPSPTATTTYGKFFYVTNIGTTSFVMLGATINPGATAALVWSNTNGGASWTFAGVDKGSILNQTSQQSGANFNIDGSGTIGTSLTTPIVQSSGSLSLQAAGANTLSLDTTGAGTVSVGATAATTINIANNAIAHTVNIANGAGAEVVTIGSITGSSSSTIINGGTGATAVLIQSGSGGIISVGSNAIANSIQIGTAGTNTGNTQNINIGNVGTGGTTNVLIGSSSAATGGTTTLQGISSVLVGNGITPLITVGASSGGVINVGSVGASTNTTTVHIADTSAAAQTVTVGSTSGASTTTVQGGTGNVTLLTNSATAGVIAKSGTNSSTAFQVQNSSGVGLLTADTSAGNVTIAGTETIQTSSATAFLIRDGSANATLALDSTSHIFKIYDTTAVNYATITATPTSATFASNTGTTIIGSGSGNISLQLTNAADQLLGAKTFTAAANLTTSDFNFTRNVTGGAFALQGSVLKVEDLSTFSGGSSSPTVLLINQNNASATGNLILATLNGTAKLTVAASGNTTIAGSLQLTTNATSAFSIQNTLGQQLLAFNAPSKQLQLGSTGNVTDTIGFYNSATAFGTSLGATNPTATRTILLPDASGTVCLDSGNCPVNTLQQAYNASSPASILLADAKDLTITAADTTTDPNIVFNLQCVTSCGSNGRFAVQNAGADFLAVNPNGTIVIGTSTNNASFGSDGTLTFNGTARHTRRYNLAPEYAGATMTADGSNNSGTMTSDFCSGSSHLTIGTTCSASAEHNYYKWVSTSGTNDYDIYVRFRMPSDYSRNSGNTNTISNFNMFGYGTTAGTDKVELTVYNASMAVCGTASFNTATTSGAWTENALTSISGDTDCDGIVADDVITLRIHMISSGASNLAQAGEIRFDYLSKW